jgi:long-chain fatty acid transport protein
MFVSLTNQIVLSGCTELNCEPENPRFDALTQAKVTAPFVPSGNAGLLYVSKYVRVGASVQLPYWIHASGTVKTKLPSDPQFDGAVVVGDALDVNLTLPLVVRAGIEVRPTKRVRVELGGDYERWSMQDKLEFNPRGVYLDHVAGIGRYDLRPMALNRSMQDSFAVHVGGEVDVIAKRLTLRAGYLFESSAVPDKTLSVLTPDGDKHLLTLGLGVHLGRVRLDAAYGHFFQGDRVVSNSESWQLNPIQPSINPPVAVGNGKYVVANDVLSLGLEVRY